jgi:copper homeostasis protein
MIETDVKLEVIATQINDALIAAHAGTDRIELITGILEGGLTPSHGTIEEVVQSVNVPVNVMVRPHSQSFCYSAEDLKVMAKDVEVIRRLGANGIVIGALNGIDEIDEYVLQSLLDKAETLEVTFHRAFDVLKNQEAALEVLFKYPQITRVLTSGGKSDVNLAVDRIKQLVEHTKGTHLTVLAGSGLKLETLQGFVEKTGVSEVHFGTGARIRSLPLQPIDSERVLRIREILSEFSKQEGGPAS